MCGVVWRREEERVDSCCSIHTQILEIAACYPLDTLPGVDGNGYSTSSGKFTQGILSSTNGRKALKHTAEYHLLHCRAKGVSQRPGSCLLGQASTTASRQLFVGPSKCRSAQAAASKAKRASQRRDSCLWAKRASQHPDSC